MGRPFTKVDDQEANIGFYGDRFNGSELNGIVIMGTMWKWKNAQIVMDPIPVAGFYGVVRNEKESVCPRSRILK